MQYMVMVIAVSKLFMGIGSGNLRRGLKERMACGKPDGTVACSLKKRAGFQFGVKICRLGTEIETNYRDNKKEQYLKKTPDTSRYVALACLHKHILCNIANGTLKKKRHSVVAPCLFFKRVCIRSDLDSFQTVFKV